jgi:hypothetical protein
MVDQVYGPRVMVCWSASRGSCARLRQLYRNGPKAGSIHFVHRPARCVRPSGVVRSPRGALSEWGVSKDAYFVEALWFATDDFGFVSRAVTPELWLARVRPPAGVNESLEASPSSRTISK